MFLHLCVILFTGRGSVSEGGSTSRGRGGLCIGGGAASRGGSASSGGLLPVGVCFQWGSASGGVGSASKGLGRQLPPHRILWDTVNEQVVCILLECILVFMHVCLFISEVVPEPPRTNPTQTKATPPPGAVPPEPYPPGTRHHPPPGTTKAGGTHYTGMLSCFHMHRKVDRRKARSNRSVAIRDRTETKTSCGAGQNKPHSKSAASLESREVVCGQ